MSNQTLSVGRIVHVVLEHGKSHHSPVIRPAIVVRVWSPETANVQVFTDSDQLQSSNDCRQPVLWMTSVHHDPAGDKVGTWHWPPTAASIAKPDETDALIAQNTDLHVRLEKVFGALKAVVESDDPVELRGIIEALAGLSVTGGTDAAKALLAARAVLDELKARGIE